jgi:hypothetical protein
MNSWIAGHESRFSEIRFLMIRRISECQGDGSKDRSIGATQRTRMLGKALGRLG